MRFLSYRMAGRFLGILFVATVSCLLTVYPVFAQGAGHFSISGTITLDPPVDVTEVNLELIGVVTDIYHPDASGSYSMTDLPEGDYVVTPSLTNYAFTPESRSYAPLDSDRIGQDFAGIIIDAAAPELSEATLSPYPGQGLPDDPGLTPRVSAYSFIRARLFDESGIACDETAIKARDADTEEEIVGETIIFPACLPDSASKSAPTEAWAIFVPDFESTYPDGLPYGMRVEVTIEAHDIFGNWAIYFEDGSYQFKVEEFAPVLPAQTFFDPDPGVEGDTISVTLNEGMPGTWMEYPDTLVPQPEFGPLNELPPLPTDLDGHGVALNLSPPMVFGGNCVSIFIPLPAGTNLREYEIWHYDPNPATGWREATEGDGWLQYRINHRAYPDPFLGAPTIELCVNHFTGLQLAIPAYAEDEGDGGDGGGGGSSAFCFIATAAYGTPLSDEVVVLRQFRDSYLLTNRAGRAFVDCYYRVGPGLAELIADHESLRAIVRILLRPAVFTCRIWLESPLLGFAIAAVGLGGLLFILAILTRSAGLRRYCYASLLRERRGSSRSRG